MHLTIAGNCDKCFFIMKSMRWQILTSHKMLISWPLLILSAGLDRKGLMLIKMRFETKYIYVPLLSSTGLNYAACLEDSSSGGGGRSELVIFSSSIPGNFTREQCNSVCFAASHRYGGLGKRHECLCSTLAEPNFISESQCSAACTNPQVMEVCGTHRSQIA